MAGEFSSQEEDVTPARRAEQAGPGTTGRGAEEGLTTDGLPVPSRAVDSLALERWLATAPWKRQIHFIVVSPVPEIQYVVAPPR